MKTWMRTWIGHTIRIEKDASITWRTPKGRVIRREVSARLAESLRASKGKYKLDLSRTPLKLRNLASTRELASCYVLIRRVL